MTARAERNRLPGLGKYPHLSVKASVFEGFPRVLAWAETAYKKDSAWLL